MPLVTRRMKRALDSGGDYGTGKKNSRSFNKGMAKSNEAGSELLSRNTRASRKTLSRRANRKNLQYV